MASPPGTDVIRYERPEPPEIGVTDLVRRVTDLGLGALSVASTVAVDAIERYVPPEPGEGSPTDPGLLRHVPGALVGLGVAAQRQVLRVTAAGERTVGSTVGAVARTPVIGAPIRDVEAYLVRWADRGDIEQARSRARLGDLVRSLAPELATAVLEQLDIATLVDQLPVDAIVAKVDLDALLERVDVDAIVKRVDVGAIIDRVDLGPMVARVLDEVDIGALIRDSTGSITGDVVDGGRVTAMRVDGVIERVSDRILFRKRPRDLAVGRDDDADGAPS